MSDTTSLRRRISIRKPERERAFEVPAERLYQALQRTRADWAADCARWHRDHELAQQTLGYQSGKFAPEYLPDLPDTCWATLDDHGYRSRLCHTRRRGVATLGLAETVAILEHSEVEALRIGMIKTADRAWTFMLFFDATATTVLACARGGRVQPEGD
ncbi:hypothetical protein [Streptomyces sp. NPDC002676]